jgi:hypothetical protein
VPAGLKEKRSERGGDGGGEKMLKSDERWHIQKSAEVVWDV